MNVKTRKLTLMAMLSALAYLIMLIGRIPVVLFLSYDPKDIVIATGGFLLGPLAGAGISLLVSLVEMVTVSDTGFIGFFMNVLSTCAFVLPAAWMSKRRHTLKGAAAGLAIGVACMVAVMIAWNYIVTPLYMGVTREAVAELLIPAFLPFNLLKGSLNAGITMLVYKPVSQALARAHLLPRASTADAAHPARRFNPAATLTSAFVVVTAVLCFWFLSLSLIHISEPTRPY